MKVFVDLITRSEMLREPSGDGWDRGVFTNHLEEVRVYPADNGYYEIDVKLGDTVFVLIEDYASGDSFGRTDSNFDDKAVFTTYEAAEAAQAGFIPNKDYFGGHNDWLILPAFVLPQRK